MLILKYKKYSFKNQIFVNPAPFVLIIFKQKVLGQPYFLLYLIGLANQSAGKDKKRAFAGNFVHKLWKNWGFVPAPDRVVAQK